MSWLRSERAMRYRHRLAVLIETKVAPWIERTPVLNVLDEKTWIQDHYGEPSRFAIGLQTRPLELTVRIGRTTFGIGR